MKNGSNFRAFAASIVACCFLIKTSSVFPGVMSWSLLPTSVVNKQDSSNNNNNNGMDRRSFGVFGGAALLSTVMMVPSSPSYAMPAVTTAEFATLLRDSSKSVSLVELSGPASETIVVTLVDGTVYFAKATRLSVPFENSTQRKNICT